MRLIDANELNRLIQSGDDLIFDAATERELIYMIDHQPTIEAEPVRHGHWMFLPQKNSYLWKCSKCKGNFDQQFSFCPHCGSKMDGCEYDDDGSGVGQTFSPD